MKKTRTIYTIAEWNHLIKGIRKELDREIEIKTEKK